MVLRKTPAIAFPASPLKGAAGSWASPRLENWGVQTGLGELHVPTSPPYELGLGLCGAKLSIMQHHPWCKAPRCRAFHSAKLPAIQRSLWYNALHGWVLLCCPQSMYKQDQDAPGDVISSKVPWAQGGSSCLYIVMPLLHARILHSGYWGKMEIPVGIQCKLKPCNDRGVEFAFETDIASPSPSHHLAPLPRSCS